MSPRDVPGALGGSRILAVPEVAAEVAALVAALDRPGPRLLEIGFDHGRRLTATAHASPDWTVVGLEVRRHRVDAARAWAAERGLTNLFAFRLDARAVLANGLPAGRLDVIEALFPTPWPEGKARRRLLVTVDLLRDAARALTPRGLLHVATDVSWYAEHIAACLPQVADVLVPTGAAALAEQRPPCSQRSRREWRCEQDGLAVHRFTLVRTP